MVISIFRHIDSHRKLIHWGLVIHGCIDGYSRLVIYLYWCKNNRAETVKPQFLEVTRLFLAETRTFRSWYKNIEVADEMLKNLWILSKSFLNGLSAHNQKIERLWKDVLHYVLHYYIDWFYFMEANEILDHWTRFTFWLCN